ncbi:hypothetical protein FRC02_000518 [Tulasnella sp. 418]|nr:hypothetical protein FRC02_000518 [Tulasnella sp. 418]
MIAVEDAEPSGTALKDDVEKLKSNLKSLECDLQPLISKRWIRRIFDYEKIEKGLDEALDLVEKCEKSFQTTCMCHIVTSNEKTAVAMRNIASSSLATQNNTISILNMLSEFRLHWSELVRSKQPPLESAISVKVRSLGARNGREVCYDMGPKDTVCSVKKRMNDENRGIANIHFFSWSERRHQLTASGQDWRYRKSSTRLSMIRSECGRLEDQDVDWRLEIWFTNLSSNHVNTRLPTESVSPTPWPYYR